MEKRKEVFDGVDDCIKALKNGEIVILVDSHERENEGDFVLAASKATEEKLNFMLSFGRGVMCAPVSREKAQKLGLQKMTQNTDRFETPFTVSVDAKDAATGVSVSDRLKTIKLLADQKAKPSDFVKPGHVFPLVSKQFGVLERQGHTEGSVDLMKLSGLPQAGVIIEIMNKDGSMARLKDLIGLKRKLGLKMISIQQIANFRASNEQLLEKVASPKIPTEFGAFRVFGFKDKVFGKEYIAVVKGKTIGKEKVPVRIHSACFTGDVLFSKKCDCRQQLSESLKFIQKNDGVVVYAADHEGRGIGLLNKLRAYALQERGLDTVEANIALGFKPDQRDYAMQAQVIKALGVKSIKIISNNPEKISEIEKFGIKVLGRIPLKISPNKFNKNYLETKKNKMNHML